MLDADKFINSVKLMCEKKGVAPKTACRESGAGDNLLTNVRNGSSPSVSKVQQLAKYLGCTTSDLLGETYPSFWPAQVSACLGPESLDVAAAYQQADERSRAMVRLALGLDNDTGIAARGGKTVKKPSPASAETLDRLSEATEEAAREENDNY